MTKKKIAIFIPTYNAAKTLPILIDRIPEKLKKEVKEIFVVDDASQDNTYFIGVGYKKEKNLSNLKVFKNEKNKGYGGNQKYAYQYAIDKGFDIVVMLHGDAQYAPEKIPYLLEPLEKGKADMVFGSRMKGNPLKGGMPLMKFIGNKILTWIENKVLGLNLSEYHSGFRLYSCAALKKIPFNLCADDFHFDTDILIQFKVANLRIAERPIPTYYGDEKSHVKIFSYGFNILKSLYGYLLHKYGIKKVKKFDIKPVR
ncbi:glycosyltransferase family 2 protein [Candidatus Woesearchaeota archaeon]|nr:glycosyltransferase family 2 protein [Candidatus Woesearchaeota archaeon]